MTSFDDRMIGAQPVWAKATLAQKAWGQAWWFAWCVRHPVAAWRYRGTVPIWRGP